MAHHRTVFEGRQNQNHLRVSLLRQSLARHAHIDFGMVMLAARSALHAKFTELPIQHSSVLMG